MPSVSDWEPYAGILLLMGIAYVVGRGLVIARGLTWRLGVALTAACLVLAIVGAEALRPGPPADPTDPFPGVERVFIVDPRSPDRGRERIILFALSAVPCWLGMAVGRRARRTRRLRP